MCCRAASRRPAAPGWTWMPPSSRSTIGCGRSAARGGSRWRSPPIAAPRRAPRQRSVGGNGTEDALAGALDMSETLRGLELRHTYLNMPYEAKEFLVDLRKIQIKRGPEQEGPPPYTAPDPVLRTTPAEMSRIFLMID